MISKVVNETAEREDSVIITDPTAVIDTVMVYGTLKKGNPNHNNYIKDSEHLGYARIKAYMLDVGYYPALVLANDGPWAYGEVYRVDNKVLERLDRLEGVPNHYVRVPIYTLLCGPCWVYVYPFDRLTGSPAGWNVIDTGRWYQDSKTKTPYIRFLNDHPEYKAPEKPTVVFDKNLKVSIVKQSWYIAGAGKFDKTPMVIQSTEANPPSILPPPKKEEIVPDLPDEAFEGFKGFEATWL